VDYSHGIRVIGPTAIVNGQSLPTVELYQHPVFSKLVSNEGPVKVPRYPSRVPPAAVRPVVATSFPAAVTVIPGVRTMPSISQYALQQIARSRRGG
jgi:hypothetical protein